MENANKKCSASYIYFDIDFITDRLNPRYLMFCRVNIISFVDMIAEPCLRDRPELHKAHQFIIVLLLDNVMNCIVNGHDRARLSYKPALQ